MILVSYDCVGKLYTYGVQYPSRSAKTLKKRGLFDLAHDLLTHWQYLISPEAS